MRKFLSLLLLAVSLSAQPHYRWTVQRTIDRMFHGGFQLLVPIVAGTAPAGGDTAHACGNTGTATSGNGGNNNYAEGSNACVPPSNATVQSCVINVYSNPGYHIKCAVYADSGGAPTGAPLCVSAEATSVSGANTLPLSGCGTLTAGARYFTMANTDSSQTGWGVAAGGAATAGQYQSATYATTPFPTGGSWSGDATIQTFAFYLNIIY